MSVPDIVALAEEYAHSVREGTTGVYATHDPKKAAANRPCVLVGLPTLDWRGAAGGTLDGDPSTAWRFICVASKNTAAVESVVELQTLIDAVALVFDVETATPTRYRLGQDDVPAYVLTINDPV